MTPDIDNAKSGKSPLRHVRPHRETIKHAASRPRRPGRGLTMLSDRHNQLPPTVKPPIFLKTGTAATAVSCLALVSLSVRGASSSAVFYANASFDR